MCDEEHCAFGAIKRPFDLLIYLELGLLLWMVQTVVFYTVFLYWILESNVTNLTVD
jgi:hypothetical protein